ncbi:MAG: carbohydrate ABC transporter permease [Kiritimatiellae bacterium]|nr:carbohydrate ABC transporter permease [Kiritimatiellia bacterium]
MPVILPAERKSTKARLFLALIYAVLTIGGLTMVWPFLVMLSASFTSAYDYHRYSPVVRAFWDRPDRFMRHISSCFERFPLEFYPDAPEQWGSWIVVSRDEAGCRAFAAGQLAAVDDPATFQRWQRAAADYANFNLDYDPLNSSCNYDPRHIAAFVRAHFERRVRAQDPQGYAAMRSSARQDAALQMMNQEWLIRYRSFFGIRMVAEERAPLHHASWDYPPDNPKFALYQEFKRAYRELEFETGCQGWRSYAAAKGGATEENWRAFKHYAASVSPMSASIPYASRNLWLKFLALPDTQVKLGLAEENQFSPADYSAVAGHLCRSFQHLPFPLPEDSSPMLRQVWADFIHNSYPRRLLRIKVTPALEAEFQGYVANLCKSTAAYTKLTGVAISSFAEITLHSYENSSLWRNFAARVPLGSLTVLSAESEWQRFLLEKYGSVAGVNASYGWELQRIEEARFPVREALAVTFKKRGWQKFFAGVLSNYRLVGEYLFLRGRAFGNTLLLLALSILATLTVNPLAAYALSRFGLRSTEKILLFLLSTMAFPAAVTAIPGFLLIRDLGLLNTFAALVLPTVANGMSIFILKGFFDGLPRELYEAATVDGAKEWQIFLRITLPMTTPILAVNALHAFVVTYNSWEWALLVCQKQSYWTLAVWMYQMSQQFSGQPWAVMAGFVLISLPTALVFIACQRVILRGIVLPSMK